MRLFKNTLTIDFMSRVKITGIVSVILLIVSAGVLLINGLNLTIEFTGGTNLNV